ncbi:hypothetical protein SEVIR_5G177521v4 [Setaria viridis]
MSKDGLFPLARELESIDDHGAKGNAQTLTLKQGAPGIFKFLPSLRTASIQMPVLELLIHFCHQKEMVSYICDIFACVTCTVTHHSTSEARHGRRFELGEPLAHGSRWPSVLSPLELLPPSHSRPVGCGEAKQQMVCALL